MAESRGARRFPSTLAVYNSHGSGAEYYFQLTLLLISGFKTQPRTCCLRFGQLTSVDWKVSIKPQSSRYWLIEALLIEAVSAG